MSKGRPTLPIEQKQRRGTLRADRLPNGLPALEMVNSNELPEPLRELGEAGSDFWQKVFETGGRWISHKTDITLCQIVAEQLDERDQLRELVMSEKGSRERSGLRELEKALVSNLSLLGFTPSDRSRLGVAEVKTESKLEELMRRKAERETEFRAGE
jgi:hypothetical protein